MSAASTYLVTAWALLGFVWIFVSAVSSVLRIQREEEQLRPWMEAKRRQAGSRIAFALKLNAGHYDDVPKVAAYRREAFKLWRVSSLRAVLWFFSTALIGGLLAWIEGVGPR